MSKPQVSSSYQGFNEPVSNIPFQPRTRPSTRLPAEDMNIRHHKQRSSVEFKGPRLQASTSGLKFDSPVGGSLEAFDDAVSGAQDGKVQRELDLARERSRSVVGWRNVAEEAARGAGWG